MTSGILSPLIGNWDGLRIPLLTIVEGSKIAVTSSSETAARILVDVPTHQLEKLSPEDSWYPIYKACISEWGDSSTYPQLEPIGREIVNKCQGLPLAVKALRRLLYSKVRKKGMGRYFEQQRLVCSDWSGNSSISCFELSSSFSSTEALFCLLFDFSQGL